MPHNWNQCPQKGPLFSLSQDNQHANDNFVARYHQSAAVGPQSSSHDDALLLASFADIASKIVSKPIQESHSLHALPPNDAARPLLSCQFPSLPSNVSSSSNATFKGNPRPRTISYSANEVSRSKLQRLSGLAQTSLGLMQTSEQLQCSLATKSHVITQQEIPQPPCRVILRKKFSWKHYPPLEEFLIANREEYLRHSTLNYTLQQKKYNNMLTQQMIQLASQHRLVFDKNDFSFVTVRDRIRCYYKSYVQSLKKRGVICGYAARKAGLISKEEMNKSAATKSKIFVPH